MTSESRRVARGVPPPRAASPRVMATSQKRAERESFGSPTAWASPIMASRHLSSSSAANQQMESMTMSMAAPAEPLSGREHVLQQQLVYTQDVLRKYKTYVESRVMEQLRQSQRAVEVLQSDQQRVQREKEHLVGALHAKSAELETRMRADVELSEKHTRDLQQLSAQYTRDVAAMERLHTEEVASLRQTVETLRSDVAQTQAIQVALNRRDDEVKKLRQSLAETSNRTAWAHNDHAALSECFSDVKQASLELQDFYATVAAAVREQLSRTTTLTDGGAASELDQRGYELSPLDHFSAGSGVNAPHDARAGSAQQAARQIKALREQLSCAQQGVIVMLKVELQAHNAAVDAYEAGVAQLETERALARRRMEELEDDRRQERQHMAHLLEESKLKSVLSQATPSQLIRAATAGSSRTAALSPVPSSLTNGVLDVASVILATQPQSPQRRVRQVSTGVQTALEVSVFALPPQPSAVGGSQAVPSTNGGAGSVQTAYPSSGATSAATAGVSAMTYNRVLSEVTRLQEDNHRLAQSVALLDAQRRRFLGFVNDRAISDHIDASLREGSFIDIM